MERRFLVAILLSFVVLYTYQALFVPRAPESTSAESTPQEVTTKPAEAAKAVVDSSPRAESPTQVELPEAASVSGEETERQITVDTNVVQAVFTNQGARLLHWRLKSYRDKSGNLVDLVPSDVPADEMRPFSLRLDDEAIGRRVNSALYRVSGDQNAHVDATDRTATLTFTFEDSTGVSVSKEFVFDPSSYMVTLTAKVTANGKELLPAMAWGPGLGDVVAGGSSGGFLARNTNQPPEALYYRDGKVERVRADKVEDQGGTFRFAGVDDHYFMAATVDPGQARLQYRAVTLPGPGDTKRQLLAHSIQPAQSQPLRVFVGPKQFDTLKSVDQGIFGGEAIFVRAINFGMFGFLSVPLLNALKWVHGYIGNWGWSIIVLTILINLAIAPLRHKSVVSMRKMQALQPQLKAIQDHYAGLKVTDPARQKMNTEIMNLYREKGVNPASGCVPMLLTLPILFAFYSLLSQAIELRGADFALWIHDLSEHDPYYVTPVLMAISMFWQQRMTPSTADPAQQKIMMMMPLMFGVMFLWVPSGLVLYWFVGNLWAIGQQYFTNWMIGPPVVAVARPAAERRLKSAGTGRTAAAERKS